MSVKRICIQSMLGNTVHNIINLFKYNFRLDPAGYYYVHHTFVQLLRYRIFSANFLNILLHFHVKTFPGLFRYIQNVLLFLMDAQYQTQA
jgi:hypothetical protein